MLGAARPAFGSFKVSVVVPCYNGRRYLAQCLHSVAELAAERAELVVVDDGSTEELRDIVEAFSPLARYIRQPNAGPAVARNTGFLATSGQYVRFLDADDYLVSSSAAAKQVELLDRRPGIGLVYAQALNVDHLGRPFAVKKPAFTRGSYERSGASELEDLILRNHILPSVAIVRRTVLERVGMHRTDLQTGEDWDLWLRVARVSGVAYLAEPVAAYRIHPANSTSGWKLGPWFHDHSLILDELEADPDFAQRYGPQLRLARASLYARAVRISVRNHDRAHMWQYAGKALAHNIALREWRTAAWCLWLVAKGCTPRDVYATWRRIKRRSQLAVMSSSAASTPAAPSSGSS